jgi:nucleoside triphosphate pyrophosphatase
MMNSTPPFILASSSPRRKELLLNAGFSFKTVSVDVDEDIPEGLLPLEVVVHLAHKKLMACKKWLSDSLVVTADTLVFKENTIFGKPRDRQEAVAMLSQLSDCEHEVATSICLGYQDKIHQFTVLTVVSFALLAPEQINYYVDNYNPYDKAGGYGIQEWIGEIGVRKINGSYTNVVGLPLYETHTAIIAQSKKWLQ